MPHHQRNVRLAAAADRHGLERVLLASPWFNRAMSWSAQLALTALIWPRFVAPYRLQLTHYDLPLAGLGPALDGYRILHLTDFHVGRTRLSYLYRVIDRCLAEKPDLVVFTGDLIDYHPRALPPLPPLLRHLVARAGPDGVCAIFGNHDYHEYSWRHIGPRSDRRSNHRSLVQIVQDAGIHLLRNQQLTIQRGAARVTFVGMDEMWTGRADPAAAFRGLTPADPVICLQHNPDGIDFLCDYPWQYMLCGHSHGGQARFPLLGALYVPMEHRQYLQGFFHFPALSPAADTNATGINTTGAPSSPVAPSSATRRTMFVSRGIGHTTPIRLACPPEATLFTLRAS